MPTIKPTRRPHWVKPSEHRPWQHAKRWDGYNTKRWKKARLALLVSRRYQCATVGCTNPASEVDHVNPISGGCDPWDQTNWQCLCPGCHRDKTVRDRTAAQRHKVNDQEGGGIVHS